MTDQKLDPAQIKQLARAVRQHDLRDMRRGTRRRRHAARGTWRATKWVSRHTFARRRPLAPFAAFGVLYGAGYGFHLAANGAATVPLVAAVVAGGVALRAWRRRWRLVEKRYAAAIITAAYGWVQAAAVVGVAAPMPGVLLVGWAAAAGPWWWHHRIRQQDAPVEEDERFVIWAQRVAGQGCVLPGARLLNIEQLPTGWAATITLPEGKLTTESALTASTRIASAYGVPATSVVIEAPVTGEAHRARLLVLTVNPLQDVQLFPGPQLDHATGMFPVGVYADGSTAWWRLFTPDSGANHGLIAGTTGSGKSGLVNLLCTEIRHSGMCVLWLGDPEEGVSVPDWQDSADWFAASVPEIRLMLAAAERIMAGRKKRRARAQWTDDQGRQRRGLASFTPSPAEPQLTIVVDESPDVMADPECVRIIGLIGKKGRKLGVSVVLIAQVPSVAELGGSVTVRSMVSSTNIVMFRTSDRLSGKMGMPQDLPVDPANLPIKWPDGSPTAGLGYVASAGGRVSPMRAMFVQDPFYWATVGETVKLDQAAAKDAGEEYATWRQRRDNPAADKPAEVVPIGAEDEPKTKRAAILTQLRSRGQVRTGVLADLVGAPLSTVSSTLRRLEQEGLAVDLGYAEWAAKESAA